MQRLNLCRHAVRATTQRCLLSRALCGASGAPVPKAAALIIGSEVLTGKIQDTNTCFLARLLYSRGVDLARVEVVPDAPLVIAERTRALSSLVGESGFVFTSGGIGPTHDDVTYESIAAAFGRPLALHLPTVERMRVHYGKQGKELNEARLRMALLPEGCAVHETPGCWVPLAQVENVFVLPGIPWLFKQMMEANAGLFRGPQSSSARLYTHAGEGDLAASLGAVAAAHPDVSIGSYPNTVRGDAKEYTTKLTFDSRDVDELAAAVAAARAAIETFDEL